MKLVGLIIACFTLPALADTPDPNKVYIKRLTYSGPGCPQGSANHNLAPDAKAFTLLFDDFYAEVGPQTPGGRSKNSCQLTVDLRFPQGWTYTLFTVDYRGYLSLDAGVTGYQRSKYYFQSQPGNAVTLQTRYVGPQDKDYHERDVLGISDVTWAPCGRNRALNIDTEIELESSDRQAQGLITVDSIDGELLHQYGIQWQRCN